MFFINLLLALTWVALTGEVTIYNFGIGLILGFIVLWLIPPASNITNNSNDYVRRVRKITEFFFFFLYTLLIANIRMALYVLNPYRQIRPGIVAIPLDIRTDTQITMLLNLITLTPGTLSLDVSDAGDSIYVHVIHVEDKEAFRQEIKQGFEKRIQEIFP
ncbi:MAG TPA: Na+/H+ antiporter subunit E [Anaerolineae bacterium]|nr:Na+/H+ antiporter subunit E [Anaerolineae bacterium]